MVNEAADSEFFILQNFQVLARMPFKQRTESEISHFIVQALLDGCLDFSINCEWIVNLQLSDTDVEKIILMLSRISI